MVILKEDFFFLLEMTEFFKEKPALASMIDVVCLVWRFIINSSL